MSDKFSKNEIKPSSKSVDETSISVPPLIETATSVPPLNVRTELQKRFTACMCREILKLGRSRKDKTLGKEFIRLLSQQDIESWVDKDSASVIQTALQLAEKSSDFSERATAKNIYQIKDICKKIIKKKVSAKDAVM